MNSPSSTIRSSVRLAGATWLAAALLAACGGSAPDPGREHARDPAAAPAPDAKDDQKGSGGLNFNYTNKSTFARLNIDLGSTDVYLDMTGRPAKSQDDMAPDRGPQDPRYAAPQRAQAPDNPMQPANPNPQQPGQAPAPQAPKAKPEAPQDQESADDQGGNEDVTSKVLAGIRRAQEMFYQKRYPEALQMVRQSLDAQPTAEGHALAGSICYMMNKTGLARRHWEDALRLNPDMPAVVNMLERTRTPGGRGSPSPRPIVSRPAPREAPPSVMQAANPGEQPPFPEELDGEPAGKAAPAPAEGSEDVTGSNGPAPVPQPAPRPSARHLAPTAPLPAAPAPSAVAPKSELPAAQPARAPKAGNASDANADDAPANASEDAADAPADESESPADSVAAAKDASPKNGASKGAKPSQPASVPAKSGKGK